MAYTPPTGSNVSFSFSTAYTPPVGNNVSIEFIEVPDAIAPSSILAGIVGTHTIENAEDRISPFGIASGLFFGSHTIVNALRVISGVGLGVQLSWGDADIRLKTRWIYPSSMVDTAFGTHIIAGEIRYLYPDGLNSFVSGSHRIEYTVREIVQTPWFSLTFGAVTVLQQRYILPTSWESSAFGDIITYVGQTPLPVQGFTSSVFGQPEIKLKNQYVSVAGTDQYGAGFPYVENQNRLITGVTLNPDPNQALTEFGNRLFWFVENRNRVLGPSGWQSSRFGPATIELGLTVELATLGDQTAFGTHLVAYRIRSYTIGGYDFSYVSPSAIVYNAARVLYPSGFTSYAVGTPGPVFNANRTLPVQQFETAEYGTAFIAYRVRTVVQNETLYPFVPLPEVRLDPFPIAPAGIDSYRTGGHEVVERFTTAAPFSFNVFVPERVSEPQVRNRNLTVVPWPVEFTEYGIPSVYNKTRYILTAGLDSFQSGVVVIADRTRTVRPVPPSLPSISVLHRIFNSVELPFTQTIPPSGFSSANVGNPTVRNSLLLPEGIFDDAYGTPRVGSNTIYLDPNMGIGEPTELKMGTPELIYPRLVYPSSIYSFNEFPQTAPGSSPTGPWVPAPSVTPHYIYAPDENFPVDNGETSYGGPGWPWFGQQTVTLKNRQIFVSNTTSTSNTADGETFGTPTLELRNRKLFVVAIYGAIVSIPVFLNVPQTLTLDEFHFGIAPLNDFGTASIAVEEPLNRPVYPSGINSQAIGNQTIELFNRQIYPAGIEHKAAYWFGADPFNWPYPIGTGPNYQLFDPWGILYCGPPRRVYPDGFDSFTPGAGTFIAYRIRSVYPSWTEESEFDYPDDPFGPMRVRFKRNTYSFIGFTTMEFGAPFVSNQTRTAVPFGIFPGASGIPNVSSVIAPTGWDSAEYGDIDEWEAGKIKAHGDDMLEPGYPRIDRRIFPASYEGVMGTPSFGRAIYANGIPELAFFGPVVTNEFPGCGIPTTPVVVPSSIDSFVSGAHAIGHSVLPESVMPINNFETYYVDDGYHDYLYVVADSGPTVENA